MEIPLTPDMQSILEGLAQAAVSARQQVQVIEARVETYVQQCKNLLGLPCDATYKFDYVKRAFVLIELHPVSLTASDQIRQVTVDAKRDEAQAFARNTAAD